LQGSEVRRKKKEIGRIGGLGTAGKLNLAGATRK